ncbi:hypothetical protein D3C79_1008000 [compost metagenome]
MRLPVANQRTVRPLCQGLQFGELNAQSRLAACTLGEQDGYILQPDLDTGRRDHGEVRMEPLDHRFYLGLT